MKIKRYIYTFIILVVCIFEFSGVLYCADNKDCLECHKEKYLTKDENGTEVSLYVSEKEFENSVHSSQKCINCHRGFNPETIPHKEKIDKVNCAGCHKDTEDNFRKSGHYNQGIECLTCHTEPHNINKENYKTKIIEKCSECHSDETEIYNKSIHHKKNNGPLCINCHSSHNIKLVNSDSCLKCHSKKEIVHKDSKFVMGYKDSIHGKYVNCSDCHTGHDVLQANDRNSSVNRKNIPNTCGKCHQDIEKEYLSSDHGKGLTNNVEAAPSCIDCHGEHNIYQVTDNKSSMSRKNEIIVCLKCHLDSPEVKKRMTHTSLFVKSYENSVHGRKHSQGDLKAAICSDCHGSHSMKKASDPTSKVNKLNIESSCKKCHSKISKIYDKSIHGQALKNGNKDVPTCTTCHGEHNIIEPSNSNSNVYVGKISTKVCGPCHSSVKLSEKYGIPLNKLSTFSASYHGLDSNLGDLKAANCASCHGVHNILPSSNPESSINKQNLPKTCGKCHPGANEKFAASSVHTTKESNGNMHSRIIYWISNFYIMMIILTIGGMLFHNSIDFLRKMIEKYKERYKGIGHYYESATKLYLRMTLNERIQHFFLLTSFFTLVITGFMLKYPDAFWVEAIKKIAGQKIYELRGIIHRIAAVIMVVDSVYHLMYVVTTKRGRKIVIDLFPKIKDVKDALQNVLYNLGIVKTKPQFDRFGYIEKSEYWALVWGTIIMTITGLALWFENFFISRYTKLFTDICESIHFYEAWLAFLAIMVWHIYYVVFNPDVYPINFTWFNGKITEEEMEKEHPEELRKIKEKINEE